MLQQFQHRISLFYVMLKKGLYSLTSLSRSYLGEALWKSIFSEVDQSNLPQCKTKKRTFQLNTLEPKYVIIPRILCDTFHITK